MASIKTKNNLITLKSGTLKSGVLARIRKKVVYIRKHYEDKKETLLQEDWRKKYRQVDQTWINMTQPERELWRLLTWRRSYSNYANFMSENLKRVRAGLPIIKIPPNKP